MKVHSLNTHTHIYIHIGCMCACEGECVFVYTDEVYIYTVIYYIIRQYIGLVVIVVLSNII